MRISAKGEYAIRALLDLAVHHGEGLVPIQEVARRHSAQAVHHDQHRTAHEQLKRRHHNIIAHWNVLLKALRETAESSVPASNKLVVPSS